MDLSYYLSEILEQQGEVNVPGLGHFAKVRVNGYYNDDEARFYPPYNEIQFDPLAAAGRSTRCLTGVRGAVRRPTPPLCSLAVGTLLHIVRCPEMER